MPTIHLPGHVLMLDVECWVWDVGCCTSLQVADLVADEFRGLYRVFSKERLGLLLSRVRASAVQLVHLEGRVALPSKAATHWDPLD